MEVNGRRRAPGAPRRHAHRDRDQGQTVQPRGQDAGPRRRRRSRALGLLRRSTSTAKRTRRVLPTPRRLRSNGTLKKLLGEKFVFGEKDGGGNSMLWFASAEENYLAGVFSISGSHLVRLVPQLESGQNCSDCLFRLAQPASEGLSGSYATEANLDQSVRSRNVERCRRLLERVTEEIRRTKDNQSACRRAAGEKRLWRSKDSGNRQ